MADLKKARDFLSKANEFFKWSQESFREMQEHSKHGRVDSIKRLFFSLLGLLSSMHDALEAASGKAGEAEWKKRLSELRKNDSLLNYLWAARNVDVHDRLIEWDPHVSEFSVKIVDIEKVRKLDTRYPLVLSSHMKIWCFLMNASSENEAMKKFFKGIVPRQDRMEMAGVELVDMLHGLALVAFEYAPANQKKRRFLPPVSHLDKPLEQTVDACITAALSFYQLRLIELTNLISQQEPRSFRVLPNENKF
jgi:hypothetical protein